MMRCRIMAWLPALFAHTEEYLRPYENGLLFPD